MKQPANFSGDERRGLEGGWGTGEPDGARGRTRMGKTYRHPAMKQLKEQQTRYAPRERRLEQIDRAEQLLGEIEEAKRYPYEYLCFRITGFRPDGWPALVLDGRRRSARPAAVRRGPLGDGRARPSSRSTEPVLTVDEVSRRYNVSTRTVTRWRRQGLVARRFVIGGRTKVGFLESSLQRFVTAHRAQVERGTRFRQLTEAERDEIIRRARRMALVRPGQAGLVEIARRIARKMARSTETVRLTLKAYDRDHPDRAIFPPSAPPLDDDAKAPDLPPLPHGGLGRGPGPPVRPDPLEHLPRHQRDAGPPDPGHQARVHRPRRASTTRPPAPRSSARCPSRPTARPRDGPRPPRACPLTWPASTRSRSWTASRRCTCSAR